MNAPREFGFSPQRPRNAPQSRQVKSRGKGIILFVILALAVGGGAYALRVGLIDKAGRSVRDMQQSLLEDDNDTNARTHVSRDFNYRFVFPSDDWQTNDRLKVEVKANALAMQRNDPFGRFALAVRDYKKANPDAGAMTDEAVRRLSGYFGNFEWEAKEDIELAGRKAQRLVFQGKVVGVMMSGECCFLAHKGVAYWLTAWTTAADAQQNTARVASDFERLRKGFALGKDREQWQEHRVAVTFKGKKHAYEFRDLSGPWKEWDEPTSEDPKADLLLMGADPDDARDITRQSSVALLLLDTKDAANALLAAQTYIEARQKETFPETSWEPADAKPSPDTEVKIGDGMGKIAKFHVKNGETRERFLLLAVVTSPQLPAVVAVQCECDWRRRARWEALFVQLLATLRLPAKASE